MQKLNVLFVCLGNICRSPMAEAIFQHKIAQEGLASYFKADSAGTANYHVGKGADHRTISTVERMGIRITHTARQVSIQDLHYYDYILAMDAENRQMLKALSKADQALGGKIYLMRDFEPSDQLNTSITEQPQAPIHALAEQPVGSVSSNLSVPDPYYGGEEGFQEVFDILDRSIGNFLEFVRGRHNL